MNWTISIGSITTGSPGSPVTVTNVGTVDEAVLNISIPKGDQGQGVDDYSPEVIIPFARSVTPDLSLGSAFSLTLTGNAVLENPANATEGMGGYIVVKQDGTGNRALWFGTDWLFPDGDGSLSTDPDSIDLVAYAVRGDGKLVATISRSFRAMEQPAAWQMSDLTTPAKIDLNAASGITQVDGKVSTWASEVGALSAAQPIAAARPTLDLDGLSGSPVVLFDGVDDFMDIASFGKLAPGYSIFFLGRLGQPHTIETPLLRDSGASGGTVFNSYQRFYFYDGGTIYGTGAGVTASTAALWSIDSGAPSPSQAAFKNGVADIGDGSGLASGLPAAQMGHATDPMRIGGNTGKFGSWQVGRLVVAYVANEAERQRVEGRIMHDAGLQSLLPSDHPYRNDEPLAL